MGRHTRSAADRSKPQHPGDGGCLGLVREGAFGEQFIVKWEDILNKHGVGHFL
jgi:hypothetical protein